VALQCRPKPMEMLTNVVLGEREEITVVGWQAKLSSLLDPLQLPLRQLDVSPQKLNETILHSALCPPEETFRAMRKAKGLEWHS